MSVVGTSESVENPFCHRSVLILIYFPDVDVYIGSAICSVHRRGVFLEFAQTWSCSRGESWAFLESSREVDRRIVPPTSVRCTVAVRCTTGDHPHRHKPPRLGQPLRRSRLTVRGRLSRRPTLMRSISLCDEPPARDGTNSGVIHSNSGHGSK